MNGPNDVDRSVDSLASKTTLLDAQASVFLDKPVVDDVAVPMIGPQTLSDGIGLIDQSIVSRDH
jgi:hypothetical protein